MKTLVKWDPFFDIQRMTNLMDRLWASDSDSADTQIKPMFVDLVERGDEFLVKAAVPGMKPEEIQVHVEDGVLTIRGEHRSETLEDTDKIYRREISYGSFTRSIRLPEEIDLDSANAKTEHGLLTISFKKLPEMKPKAIQININPGRPETPENKN